MTGPSYSKVPLSKDGGRVQTNDTTSLWSRLSFAWLSGVFALGNIRPLNETDLPNAVNQQDSQDVCEHFRELWTEETQISNNPRVWKSLARLFTAWEYIFYACSLVLLSLLRVSQPVFLNLLLRELNRDSSSTQWICLYIVGLSVSGIIKPFVKSSFYYGAGVVGAHINTAITGLVYRKVLTSYRAGRLGQLTSAHVINLISKDLEPINYVVLYVPMAITGSVELLLVCFILWQLMAAEAVAGVSLVVLVWIFQSRMKPLLQRLRKETTILTDTRLRMISDVISGIRTLKMNGWERMFDDIVGETRRREINVIFKKNTVYTIFMALQSSFATTATLVSIAVMVLRGHILTAQDVFTIYAFVSAIRKPAVEDVAFAVRNLADSLVTIARVQNILLDFSENDQNGTQLISKGSQFKEVKRTDTPTKMKRPSLDAPSLVLKNVTCKGHERALLLNDVTLSCHGNKLIVITGAVGSGKSTLLTAILGELERDGQMFLNGSIAYVPQTSWLFSGTIFQNIIFGRSLSESKYQQTVEVCALKADFDLLPDGDSTCIGERGVSLSGGQRSRINLARAVYSDADIYLLDDPLSAVDTKVGRNIFEQCILGNLGNTLRVLVTHRVEYFKQADCIVVLQNGRVRCQGKYDELLTSDENFADLVQKCEEKEGSGREGVDEKETSGQPGASSSDPCDSEGFQTMEEDREVGSVSGHTYWTYVKSGIPLSCLWIVAMVTVLPEGASISANLWLGRWTNQSPADQKENLNFWIYMVLSLGTFVLSFVRAFLILICALRAAEKLHCRMLASLLLAPVRFFDTNPSGRILNRFSRSVGDMDEFLPDSCLEFLRYVAEVSSSILLVSIINPWLILANIPLVASLTWLAGYFLRTAREVKRLEAISCSPLYAHIAETIDGVVVLRACSIEEPQMHSLFRYRDKVNNAWLLFVACEQWISLRAEVLSALYLAVVTFAMLFTSTDKALVGLSIAYALDISGNVFSALVEFARTENCMTSVERVITYSNLEPESGYEYDSKVPNRWPKEGSVAFDKVIYQYYSGGPHILKDVNFRALGGERIGIVGRTGAGKSSLISAIFRMPEPKGDILIDNVAISALNLQDSRSAVAAISQNPLLFTGTLRFNLDPENKYADKALWDVLDDVSLKQLVQKLPDKLESHVTQGGGNFSVGERQLLCVARALLQDKKIVVLDEATANVDMKTDRLLQEVIRSKLKGRTILTIAHRLETILDYDKVLVIDAGKVVEFDDPRMLLERKDSEFGRLYHCSMKKS